MLCYTVLYQVTCTLINDMLCYTTETQPSDVTNLGKAWRNALVKHNEEMLQIVEKLEDMPW